MNTKVSESHFCYADTESTAFDDEKGTRIYLWILIDEIGEIHQGYDVDSLVDYLYKNKKIIFFHNLKHDFSFLEYFLLKNNKKYKKLMRKGTIYSVKIGKSQLRDSFNFLPMSLAEMGKTFNKNYFKGCLEEYEKPYDYTATADDIAYCILDVQTLREAFETYRNEMKTLLENNGFPESAEDFDKSLTISSVAFSAFTAHNNFAKLCPKTTEKDYKNLKKAYCGGFVYSNPTGVEEDVIMLDENSMYPSKYTYKPLPYGEKIPVSDLKTALNSEFSVIGIKIRFDLKPGYIAIIGNSGFRFSNVNYKKTSNGKYEDLTVSNIDLKRILRYYNCDIVFSWAYRWNVMCGLYNDYTDVFMKIKAQSQGPRRFIAKQMLNRPYGKLAINGESEEIETYLDPETDTVKMKIDGYTTAVDMFQYLPQAIAITAYARDDLLDTAEKIGFEKILYMDTDSIKFKGTETDLIGIDIDDSRLGAWKIEGRPSLFKTIAPKRYMYFENNEIGFANAGFNKKDFRSWIDLKIDEFSGLEKGQCDVSTAKKIFALFDKGFSLKVNRSKLIRGGRVIVSELKQIR